MKALITGVTGFLGSHLAEHLLSHGVEVEGMTRHFSGEYIPENIAGIKDKIKILSEFHICSLESMQMFFQAHSDYDYIFHLASDMFSSPAWIYEANITGTANLLEGVHDSRQHPVIVIPGCYDEKTRAFTEEGLKDYKDLKTGDKVLSLNLDNGNVEYKKIINIIVDNYSGEMLHFKSKSCDLLVTPNHKLLIRKNKKNRQAIFVRADELTGLNILPAGKYISDKSYFSKELYYLIGIFIGDGFLCTDIKKRPWSGLKHAECIKNRNEMGRFIEIEKNHEKEYTYERVFLAIPQNDKSRKKVEDTLNKLGIKFSDNGDHKMYIRPPKELSDVFRLCGCGANNKKIPKVLLDSNIEYLKELFIGLIDSDGHYIQNRSGKPAFGFTTISRQLVDNMIELCYKLGMWVSFINRSKESFKKIGISGKERIYCHNCYDLSISIGEKQLTSGSNANKEALLYNGNIWCVEVEDNHNLLVERNGKLAYCGNSSEMYGIPPQVPMVDGYIRDRPVSSEEFEDGSWNIKKPGMIITNRKITSKKTDFQINSVAESKLVFKLPITEDFPLNPVSAYGVSKAAQDMLGFQYHKEYGMKIVRARLFDITGPRCHQSLFPSGIANQMIRMEKGMHEHEIRIANPEYTMDYTDVRDAARALWLAATKCKPGEAYNICSGRARTVQQVIDILRMQSTAQFEVEQDKTLMHPNDIIALVGDCTKFYRRTGWKPQIGFAESMGDLLEWWRRSR